MYRDKSPDGHRDKGRSDEVAQRIVDELFFMIREVKMIGKRMDDMESWQ